MRFHRLAITVSTSALVSLAAPAWGQAENSETIAELRAEIDAKEREIAAQIEAQQQTLREMRSLLARLEGFEADEGGTSESVTRVAADPPAASTGGPQIAELAQSPVSTQTCLESGRTIVAWENSAVKNPDGTYTPPQPAPRPGCLASSRGAGIQPSANRPFAIADPSGEPNAAELAGASCALKTKLDIEVAVRAKPWMIQKCDNDQLIEQLELAAEDRQPKRASAVGFENFVAAPSFADSASVVAGRPLQPAGISPKIELNKGAKASLGISVPRYGRSEDQNICLSDKGCDAGYRSTVTLPSVELSAPLSGGEGLIFTRTFKDDPEPDEDLSDFQTGLGLKFGLDKLWFRGVHYKTAEKNLESFLTGTAVPACNSHFTELRGQGKNPSPGAAELCNRDRIVDWLVELKDDPSTVVGHSHARKAELVRQFHDAMWRAGEKDIPRVGLGASVSFSFDDYNYRTANGTGLGVDKDGDAIVVPVAGSGFLDPKARDHSRDGVAVELHGLIYQNIEDPSRKRTGIFSVPGLMWVPQVTWKREYAFANGSEANSCVIDPAIESADCAKLRYEPPRKRETTDLSLEVRGRFVNVPYLDKIGFAPKFAYNLDLDGQTFDLPLYVVSDDKFASGIRFRQSSGLEDLLGNSIDSQWSVALFFSALNFKGF